ncbi:MAG TPA: hypothetical protein VJ865_07985, partial [Gemmatimonadaceae bacterium]|nr:hypothetical protein [Gemmatimonadaceae bacterium]
ALSLHVRHITTVALYRYRARLSLSSVTSVLLMASLVLIPRQTGLELGVKEAFPLTAMMIVLVVGLIELRDTRDAARRPYVVRTAVGLLLVIVMSVADVLLASGRSLGLQIFALCCLLFLAWMLFNAWALVIGLADETSRQQLS